MTVMYTIISTYISNSRKYFLFQKPTQLLIHGQWWSILSTHLLQAEQWWQRSGLNTLHIRQYLRLLFSLSPRWKPQNTGTWPGSVVIVWKNDHKSIVNIMLYTIRRATTRLSSKTQKIKLELFHRYSNHIWKPDPVVKISSRIWRFPRVLVFYWRYYLPCILGPHTTNTNA